MTIFDRPPGEQFKISEFISLILSVKTLSDARAVVKAYRAWLKLNEPTLPATQRRKIIQDNIGWCFGEGMPQERKLMWNKVCGASHPWFGLTQPTTQEAFDAGKKLGEEHKRKEALHK